MRYTQAEKLEIIRLVETSSNSITKTLAEMDVPPSTFYRWYLRYQEMVPMDWPTARQGRANSGTVFPRRPYLISRKITGVKNQS